MNTPPTSPQPHRGLGLALVTGSSSGIGRAIAVRLARDGFKVMVHYHQNAKGAEETLALIRDLEGALPPESLQFDVRNPEEIEKALEPYKDISILINNSGIHKDNLTGLMSNSAFDEVIKTNLYGPFYLMRWCVRQMMRHRRGCIVNVSSLAGQTGNPGQINYSASKAALIAMTKTLSFEVGSRGIRVNAVAPGLIETEMTESIPQVAEMVKRIPLQRMGTAQEVAGAVSFLCSKDASYITGHTLSVNGGMFPS